MSDSILKVVITPIRFLERGTSGEFNLVVEPLTLAEVIYVLSGVYNYSAQRIKRELLALLSTDAVRLETTLLERAVIDALSRLSAKLNFRTPILLPGLSSVVGRLCHSTRDLGN